MIEKILQNKVPSLANEGYQIAKKYDIDQIGQQLSKIYHQVSQK